VGDEKQQIPGTTAVDRPKACVGTDVRYSSSSQGKENSRFVEKKTKKKKKERVNECGSTRNGREEAKQGHDWGSNWKDDQPVVVKRA